MSLKIGDAAWRRRERRRKGKEAIWQGLLVLALVMLMGIFIFNVSANLNARNIQSGFGFLLDRAGFEVGESMIEFDSTAQYFKAFLAGLINTIKVSTVSIITATILGVIVALCRLSKHPLLKFIGAAHVEFYRNIPLLVQLLLFYLLITELLPDSFDPIHFGSWALLSKAGLMFAIPNHWVMALLGAIAIGIGVLYFLRRYLLKRWTSLNASIAGFCAGCVIGLLSWLCLGYLLGWSKPEVQRFSIVGGATMSPEFLALWIGLTMFTSAAIAEIFRAGFLAVPKDQWNAAHALGMSTTETISYVIFPQALRLAIPPLASQYMNLTKNSSLAVVVGYPDLVSIGNSTINLNGQALEVIVIIMTVYLTLNLITSVLMNWINAKVTRGTQHG
ncbi:MAG: ABC transporter permease subunit [Burkholderiales bacterium]|nr:ABC transporter permease subunit [Burkholderiales bacterium]